MVFNGALTGMWHPSMALKTPGNAGFSSNPCSTSIARCPEGNLINLPERLSAIAEQILR